MRQNHEAAALAFDEYRDDMAQLMADAAVLDDDGSVAYVYEPLPVINEGRPEPADEDACEECGDVLHGVRVFTDDKRQLCIVCAGDEEDEDVCERDRCRFCGHVMQGCAGQCDSCAAGGL